VSVLESRAVPGSPEFGENKARMDGLVAELRERGVTVSCDTLWRFLRDAGISFKKNRIRGRAGSP